MAKAKKKKTLSVEAEESSKEIANSIPIEQNAPKWASFEQFWNSSVKNGTPTLLASCKAHVTALGWMEKQDKWVDGVIHFGIKIEK